MRSSWSRAIDRDEDVSFTGDGVDHDEDVSVNGDVGLLMRTSFDVAHDFLPQPEARLCRSCI